MKVLGIDHGTSCTGWGLLSVCRSNDGLSNDYIDHGFVDRPKGLVYPGTIPYVVDSLRDLLATRQPDLVALEAPKDNRGFKSTQILTELLGSIKYMLMEARYSFVEIPPSTMKLLVTGYGWSSKEEVAAFVSASLGIPYEKLVRANLYRSGDRKGKIKNYQLDGSDALGLALALVPYLRRGGKLDFEYHGLPQ